ncbi:hypothetical protein WN943_022822 [Citrus x changshan-huyou]
MVSLGHGRACHWRRQRNPINNVGTHVSRPRTVDFAAEDFLVLMATNFESAFHLSRLGQPLLKISGSSVVMMSSATGVVPVSGLSIYGPIIR